MESLGLRKSESPTTTPTPKFPPEIWALIIDCILDSLKAPETYCKSRKITRYGTQHDYVGGIGDNSDWFTIRLVCHAWAELAGPRRQLDVRRPNYRLHPRLTGVKFGYSFDDTLFRRLADTTDISSRLTSLSLLEGDRDVTPGDSIELFLDNPSSFRMVRSLVLRMNYAYERTPNLWGRLMVGYPLLLHLAVFDCFLPSQEIFFGELESLMIGASNRFRSASGTFSLPSLKNLATLGWEAMFKQLLQDHGRQLTSLTISSLYPQAHLIGDKFWTYVPNLQVLDLFYGNIEGFGSSPSETEGLVPIPAGHPLQRLCVHGLPNDKHQIERAHQILDKFPEISHFCLSEVGLYSWKRDDICRLANQRGVGFSAFAQPDSLDGLPWYKYLYHRSYRIRRKRDLLFFPFGAVLALGGGIACVAYWLVSFGYYSIVGWDQRWVSRIRQSQRETS